MIVFVVLVLMAVLLTLSCFIYCRMRDRNKVATFQKFREPEHDARSQGLQEFAGLPHTDSAVWIRCKSLGVATLGALKHGRPQVRPESEIVTEPISIPRTAERRIF